MKKHTTLLTIILVVFCSISLSAQDKSKRPSPPAQTSATVDGVNVTIDYSQPAVKGRTIWGDLVPYNKVWRTGANEASWIEVSQDVKINGQTLPKGKYGLFTIPGEDEWTIIFNETWKQWGAYEYNESKDILRVKATPDSSDEFNERFTISMDDAGQVTMDWEKLSVGFTVTK